MNELNVLFVFAVEAPVPKVSECRSEPLQLVLWDAVIFLVSRVLIQAEVTRHFLQQAGVEYFLLRLQKNVANLNVDLRDFVVPFHRLSSGLSNLFDKLRNLLICECYFGWQQLIRT